MTEVISPEQGAVLRSVDVLTHAYTSGDELGVAATPVAGFEVTVRIRDGISWGNPDSPTVIERRRHLNDGPLRDRIHAEVTKLDPSNDRERFVQQQWLEHIPYMEPRDLACALVYRALSRPDLGHRPFNDDTLTATATKDSVEYRTTGLWHQLGMQDDIGTYEFRTTPGLPLLALKRVARLERVIKRVLGRFGYYTESAGDHTNFSVNSREDGITYVPLHSLRTPEGVEIARRTAYTVLDKLIDNRGLFTPRAMLHGDDAAGHEWQFATDTRGRLMRVAPDRFEYRLGIGQNGNRALALLAMMEGFSAGWHADPAEITDSEIVHKKLVLPSESYDPLYDLALLRALQYSTFKNDRFQVDPEHSSLWREALVESLGPAWRTATHATSEDVGIIMSLIRVTKDGDLTIDDTALRHAQKNYLSKYWGRAVRLAEGMDIEDDALSRIVQTNARPELFRDEAIHELREVLSRFKVVQSTPTIQASIVGFSLHPGTHGASIDHALGPNRIQSVSYAHLLHLAEKQRKQADSDPATDVLGRVRLRMLGYIFGSYDSQLSDGDIADAWHHDISGMLNSQFAVKPEAILPGLTSTIAEMLIRVKNRDWLDVYDLRHMSEERRAAIMSRITCLLERLSTDGLQVSPSIQQRTIETKR